MKKTTLLFILFLTGLMACSTPEDKPKNKTMLPGIPIIPHHQYVDFYQIGYPKRSHVASTIRHSRRRPNGSRVKRKLPCRKRQCREPGDSPFIPQKTCSHSFSSTNTMVECGKCNGLSMPTNGLLFL